MSLKHCPPIPADLGAVPDNDVLVQLVPGPVSVPKRGERLPHPAL